MGKIAGLKNKSPETYPQSQAQPTIVQTLSGKNTSSVPLTNAFATILASPISFTPPAGAMTVVMVSGVIDSPSPTSETITVEILIDLSLAIEIVFDANPGDTPVPFSLVYETGILTGTQTIDVQAKTGAGGATAVATDVSVVVIVSSA